MKNLIGEWETSRKEGKGPKSIRITPRTNERFIARARRIRDSYRVETKKIREHAIGRLQELAEEAHRRATSKYLPTRDRQKWSQIEAYVYQTLNSIIKSYDEQRASEKLEELTERVERLMEEAQEPGKED